MRVNLFLTCSGCAKTKNSKNKPLKHQNYRTSKAKNPHGEKLSLKKYCKFCQKTAIHKEEIVK
jgi:large subunit ribosomal protein L33